MKVRLMFFLRSCDPTWCLTAWHVNSCSNNTNVSASVNCGGSRLNYLTSQKIRISVVMKSFIIRISDWSLSFSRETFLLETGVQNLCTDVDLVESFQQAPIAFASHRHFDGLFNTAHIIATWCHHVYHLPVALLEKRNRCTHTSCAPCGIAPTMNLLTVPLTEVWNAYCEDAANDILNSLRHHSSSLGVFKSNITSFSDFQEVTACIADSSTRPQAKSKSGTIKE